MGYAIEPYLEHAHFEDLFYLDPEIDKKKLTQSKADFVGVSHFLKMNGLAITNKNKNFLPKIVETSNQIDKRKDGENSTETSNNQIVRPKTKSLRERAAARKAQRAIDNAKSQKSNGGAIVDSTNTVLNTSEKIVKHSTQKFSDTPRVLNGQNEELTPQSEMPPENAL